MNKKLLSFALAAVMAAATIPAPAASAESFGGYKTEGGAALNTFTFSSGAASTTYSADLSGYTNMSLSFVFDDLDDSAETTAA